LEKEKKSKNFPVNVSPKWGKEQKIVGGPTLHQTIIYSQRTDPHVRKIDTNAVPAGLKI